MPFACLNIMAALAKALMIGRRPEHPLISFVWLDVVNHRGRNYLTSLLTLYTAWVRC